MMMALCKLQNCWADSKTYLEYYSCFFKNGFSILLEKVDVVVTAEVLCTFKSLVPFFSMR